MQTTSSHKVTVITHGALRIDGNGLFLVFADVAFSINIIETSRPLSNIKETINRALIAMSAQAKAMDSAAIM
jgi:hypothetical protein